MTLADKAFMAFLLIVSTLSFLAPDRQSVCVRIGFVIKLAGDCGELRGVDY